MPPTLDRGTSRAAIDDIPVLKKEEVYVSKSSAFGFDKKGRIGFIVQNDVSGDFQ